MTSSQTAIHQDCSCCCCWWPISKIYWWHQRFKFGADRRYSFNFTGVESVSLKPNACLPTQVTQLKSTHLNWPIANSQLSWVDLSWLKHNIAFAPIKLHMPVLDHLHKFFKSSCNFWISSWLAITPNTIVSSANISKPLVTPSSISFMYTRNNNGPKTEYYSIQLPVY